jgi:Cof subfamily protein (haloacid dehalogenase superfamily)
LNVKPRILVVDIDGTLLNRQGVVSPVDREAVTRASRSGIRVSLSTGRVVNASRRVIEYLSLNGYHMFFDGALVADPQTGEEVYAEPIGRKLLGDIVEFVGENGMTIELYSSTHYFIEQDDWAAAIRRDFFGIEPTLADFDRIWQEERIIKATLSVRSGEEKAKAELFQSHFGSRLNLSWTRTPAFPDIDFINVINPAASKGKALEELASFLGIPLSETAAIGDGDNDISLLSRAGLAIAMASAPDNLKALADHIVPDVENNGVTVAIEQFLLKD